MIEDFLNSRMKPVFLFAYKSSGWFLLATFLFLLIESITEQFISGITSSIFGGLAYLSINFFLLSSVVMLGYAILYMKYLWLFGTRRDFFLALFLFIGAHVFCAYLWYRRREIKKRQDVLSI